MNKSYSTVPNMITGKDLDYLSDMFEWNYGAYKKATNFSRNVKDEEVKQTLIKGSELFMNNLKQILTILSIGGNNE